MTILVGDTLSDLSFVLPITSLFICNGFFILFLYFVITFGNISQIFTFQNLWSENLFSLIKDIFSMIKAWRYKEQERQLLSKPIQSIEIFFCIRHPLNQCSIRNNPHFTGFSVQLKARAVYLCF